MKIVCLIQARRNNYRLQRKVLEVIGNMTMVSHVVDRCQAIEQRFPVHVITPPADVDLHPTAIAPMCDENDVLRRHLLAAIDLNADGIMRVTSDCPFIDPWIANDVLQVFRTGHYDYVANDIISTYPRGLGVELFTRESLDYANRKVPPDAEYDRVHCTPYIIRHLTKKYGLKQNNSTPLIFEGLNIRCPVPSLSEINLSVDTPADLARARAIAAYKPPSHRMVDTLVAYRKVIDAQSQTAD